LRETLLKNGKTKVIITADARRKGKKKKDEPKSAVFCGDWGGKYRGDAKVVCRNPPRLVKHDAATRRKQRPWFHLRHPTGAEN